MLIVSLGSEGSEERVRTLFRHLHDEQFFAFFGFAYMRRNEWVLLQGKRIISRQRFEKDAAHKVKGDVGNEVSRARRA